MSAEDGCHYPHPHEQVCPGCASLADFLLARIAEDEAVAVAARDGHDPLDWAAERDLPAVGMADSDGPSGYGVVIVDPARVLAECEAKRQIAEALGDMEPVEEERREQVVTLRWACQLFAQPYADHPDYREEWKP